MDINGAKALKRRLGSNGADEAPPFRVDVDVAEDAPPVYRWLGVSQPRPVDSPTAGEDDPPRSGASMFRRVGLSLR